MGPQLKVSSGRLVKPGIEPATPGLQGKRLIHNTTMAPYPGSKNKVVIRLQGHADSPMCLFFAYAKTKLTSNKRSMKASKQKALETVQMCRLICTIVLSKNKLSHNVVHIIHCLGVQTHLRLLGSHYVEGRFIIFKSAYYQRIKKQGNKRPCRLICTILVVMCQMQVFT